MSVNLDDYLPSVADFPRPGVVFRDICPLLADPTAFAQAIDAMAAAVAGWRVDRIAGIESRGLIFGAALALHMHKPLVPVRKPGKLPPPTAARPLCAGIRQRFAGDADACARRRAITCCWSTT